MNEVSVRLIAGGWSVTVGHSWCAWCQLLGVVTVCICPSPGMWGVYVCHSPVNSKLDLLASRRPWVWIVASGGWRVCMGIWGYLWVWDVYGTGVWVCVCVCAKHRAGPAGELGTYGAGECDVCTRMSHLLPLPVQEEEGTGLSVLTSYVSPICRCSWRQRPLCVAGCVRVLCVSLGYVLSFPTEWTCKWESSSRVPQPGQRPQAPRAPVWTPAVGQEGVLGQGCWRW